MAGPASASTEAPEDPERMEDIAGPASASTPAPEDPQSMEDIAGPASASTPAPEDPQSMTDIAGPASASTSSPSLFAPELRSVLNRPFAELPHRRVAQLASPAPAAPAQVPLGQISPSLLSPFKLSQLSQFSPIEPQAPFGVGVATFTGITGLPSRRSAEDSPTRRASQSPAVDSQVTKLKDAAAKYIQRQRDDTQTINELEVKIDELDERNDQLIKDNDDLEKEIEDFQSNSARENARLQGFIDKLEREAVKRNADRHTTQLEATERAKLERQISELKGERLKTEALLAKTERDVIELQSERDGLKERLGNPTRDANAMFEAAVGELEPAVGKRINASLDEFQIDVIAVEDTMKTLKTQKSELEKLLAVSEHDLSVAQDELAGYRAIAFDAETDRLLLEEHCPNDDAAESDVDMSEGKAIPIPIDPHATSRNDHPGMVMDTELDPQESEEDASAEDPAVADQINQLNAKVEELTQELEDCRRLIDASVPRDEHDKVVGEVQQQLDEARRKIAASVALEENEDLLKESRLRVSQLEQYHKKVADDVHVRIKELEQQHEKVVEDARLRIKELETQHEMKATESTQQLDDTQRKLDASVALSEHEKVVEDARLRIKELETQHEMKATELKQQLDDAQRKLAASISPDQYNKAFGDAQEKFDDVQRQLGEAKLQLSNAQIQLTPSEASSEHNKLLEEASSEHKKLLEEARVRINGLEQQLAMEAAESKRLREERQSAASVSLEEHTKVVREVQQQLGNAKREHTKIVREMQHQLGIAQRELAGSVALSKLHQKYVDETRANIKTLENKLANTVVQEEHQRVADQARYLEGLVNRLNRELEEAMIVPPAKYERAVKRVFELEDEVARLRTKIKDDHALYVDKLHEDIRQHAKDVKQSVANNAASAAAARDSTNSELYETIRRLWAPVLPVMIVTMAIFYSLDYLFPGLLRDGPTIRVPTLRIDTAAYQAANEFTRMSVVALRAAGLTAWNEETWLWGRALLGLSSEGGGGLAWTVESWLGVDRGLLG